MIILIYFKKEFLEVAVPVTNIYLAVVFQHYDAKIFLDETIDKIDFGEAQIILIFAYQFSTHIFLLFGGIFLLNVLSMLIILVSYIAFFQKELDPMGLLYIFIWIVCILACNYYHIYVGKTMFQQYDAFQLNYNLLQSFISIGIVFLQMNPTTKQLSVIQMNKTIQNLLSCQTPEELI